MTRLNAAIVVYALTLATAPAPVMAQVPVNDAARTDTETRTKVCMTRARSFKQATVSPTDGVKTSMTATGDVGGMSGVSGQSVMGSLFNGTTIAGNDFQILGAIASGIEALKTNNAGQVLNSLAAVAAALSANRSALQAQSAAIGASTTQKGALDQNTMARIAASQVWNQAIEAVNTRNSMRNQKILDQAADESALSNFMRGKN
jgi:hypothetical protein